MDNPKDLEKQRKLQKKMGVYRYSATGAYRRLLWNLNRLAGLSAKDSVEERKAKLVSMVVSGTDTDRKFARIRLALLEITGE